MQHSKRTVGLVILSLIFIATITSVVSAADVGYILTNKNNVNKDITGVFNELNLTYDLILDKNINSSFDFSKYKLFFVDDTVLVNSKNITKFPIYKFPVVIMNKLYGPEWGITTLNGISQITSTSPLSLKLSADSRVQVYTQSQVGPGGSFIPLYYLVDKNKANVTSVARAFKGGGLNDTDHNPIVEVGDGIAHVNTGTLLTNNFVEQSKMCFYGIAKTQFWTENAKNLFEQCLGFVASTCSSNADCPVPTQTGKFCTGNEIFQNITTTNCINPNSINSQCIAATTPTPIQACQAPLPACFNGVCIQCSTDSDCNDNNPNTEDTCVNANTLNATCTHNQIACFQNSDCGLNGLTGSVFCSTNKTLSQNFITFTCNNPGTSQSSCSNSLSLRTNQTCPGVCSDNSCKVINCTKNSDCNDNNQETEDTCLNPGTFNSSCQNTPITCHQNTDCGINFLSDNMCSGKDIIQTFTNFTCMNPGTGLSFCSNTTGTTKIQTCAQQCFNGQCNVINCTQDSDCNDNNIYTIDKCNNPNTAQSYCSHSTVNCINNNDCGFNGFSGNEFCLQSNLFKNFQNSTCMNPGTTQSFCNSMITSLQVQDCGTNSCSNLSQPFCNGNSVFQSQTCFNTGCSNNQCFKTPTSHDQKIQDCTFGCSNGQCLPQCNNNADCGSVNQTLICSGNNLLNITIIPTCSEGTCGLQMTNNSISCQFGCSNNQCLPPPTCSHDTDCGAASVSADFCQGNNITQNFTTPKCINAGQQNSFCRNDSSLVVDTTCKDFCSNGQCENFVCHNNSECNDNNPNTEDICVNPNTINSVCTHTNITCFQNTDCGTNSLSNLFCSENNVKQNQTTFTCNNPGTILSFCSNSTNNLLNQTCQFGCSLGQCLPPPRCTLDTDCGNAFTSADFCTGNNVTQNTTIPRCINSGQQNAFCRNDSSLVTDTTCPDFCSNGHCQTFTCHNNSECNDNNVNTEDICQNPNTINSVCTHTNITCFQNTDCGINFLSNNVCSGKDVIQTFTNFTCMNPGTGLSFCSNTTGTLNIQTCAQQCFNGQCNVINCTQDSDCNDNNNRTVDQCAFAGTPSSFCRHTEVNCLSDIDCGFTGFSGNEFCLQNIVSKNFRTSTCNNPGTLNSSCSATITSQSLQDCGTDSCSNFSDNFCQGNNVVHSQTCSNRGCSIGSCFMNTFENTSIVQVCQFGCSNGNCLPQCTKNSDCGNTTSILSCSGNNLLNVTTIPTCTSGTCGTQTTNTTTICANGCSNNQCLPPPVVCTKDIDCGNAFTSPSFCQGNNVTQNTTIPRCINSGQQNAFCRNETSTIVNQTCSFMCSNGNCLPPPIVCSNNSDCGNVTVSNPVCASNKIIQNTTIPTCLNPGTPQSRCIINVTQTINQTCAFGCVNNSCKFSQCAVDSDGLVALWKFDCNVKDASGNNNDGTNFGAMLLKTGKFNGSAQFNLAQYIVFPDTTCLNLPQYTTETWFYLDSLPTSEEQETMLSKGEAVGNDGINYKMGVLNKYPNFGGAGPKLYCQFESTKNVDYWITHQIDASYLGKWNHLACTFDGTNWKMYVNGQLVSITGYNNGGKAYTNFAGIIPDTAFTNIDVGAFFHVSPTGLRNFYSGKLDDMAIYNRALNASVIASQFSSASGIPPKVPNTNSC